MKLFILVIAILAAFPTFGQNVDRRDRFIKLPSGQAVLEVDTLTTPVVADADRLLNDQATSNSVTTTVTSFLAQPDVCRTLSITPGGTTTDVPAGNVVVTGKNAHGKTITESFAFAANASSATNGAKAFCSVSSIVFPVQDGGAATYDVGVLDALGLDRCMANAGDGVFATYNGAYETTRGTWVADSDEVEKNTYDPNGTLDGAKTVRAFYVQNHGCYP